MVIDSQPGHSRRYLLVGEGHVLCDQSGRLRLLDESEAEPWLATADCDFLGHWNAVSLYALHLVDSRTMEGCQWLGLRTQLGLLDDQLFSLVGNALQWSRWRLEHRFCGRCGGPTEPMPAGEPAHRCPRCELRFYPRLSPCMITLVTRGDHCLLARHARSRQGIHTALAGFVEIGERVEDTVHREVMEEVGLTIKAPRYFASQPWPFPGQLMLGFHAEYDSGDIQVDCDEIVEANWWRYDNLPVTPPPQTIAGQLIADFVAQQHNKCS